MGKRRAGGTEAIQGRGTDGELGDIEGVRRLLAECPGELWDIGLTWYPMVRAWVQQWARDTGYSEAQVAGVVAVYSARRQWGANVSVARRAVYDGEHSGLSDQVRKAQAILALDPATADIGAVRPYLGLGRKVPNFCGSILHEDCCACDVWMFSAFGFRQGEADYPACERGIRTLAREHGLAARDMQAIIWLAMVARAGRSVAGYHPAQERGAA